MKTILLAIQFLTRLPIKVKTVTPIDLACSMIWFPVIGLLIGAIWISVAFAASWVNLPTPIIAAGLVLILVILTGGLHLDGLSDMCDGFYAGKTREEILSIMRDSHIGAIGVISIVLALLLKYNILWALLNLNSISRWEQYRCLTLGPMISRWGMVVASALFPYARLEGTAQAFIEHLKPKYWIIATLVTYAIAVGISGLPGFILCTIGLVIVIMSVIYIKHKIGGMTGDTLGAINEILEVIILFAAYLIYRK